MLGSCLLTISTWLLILKPELFNFIPKISTLSGPSYYDLLPPLPSKMSIAYKLGTLEQQLITLETSNNKSNSTINNILKQATKILGRNPKHEITTYQLHGILDEIIKYENKKSWIGSIFGIFSFVNMVWFLSIIGISVTVIPVIYLLGQPIWVPLWIFCRTYLMETAYLLKNILLHPFALQMYEILGYFICWYFIYIKFDSYDNDVGFYMSFTGVMLWHPLLWLSFYIRDIHNRTSNTDAYVLYPLFLSLICMPLGYHYQSYIFGFICVFAMYIMTGEMNYDRCICCRLGSFSDKAVRNYVEVSLMFNVLLISIKVIDQTVTDTINFEQFGIFIQPMLLLANIGLYSLLLYNAINIRGMSDIVYEIPLIVALILGIAFGNVLNFGALKYTSYVFGVLYLIYKLFSVNFIWDMVRNVNVTGMIVGVFVLSVFGWKFALFLHTHPQIIVGMFRFDG